MKPRNNTNAKLDTVTDIQTYLQKTIKYEYTSYKVVPLMLSAVYRMLLEFGNDEKMELDDE